MKWKKYATICLVTFCCALVLVFVKAYMDGEFQSIESLQSYVKGFGIFAPAVLIIIQAMQVIIPILPGFLGCAVGAVMFGSAGGFWCNYIGISLGSILAFIIARQCGVRIVEKIFSKEQYDKYSAWATKSYSYTALLFAGMILPLFPDDFFCYFTGLTKMGFRKFALIILIGKPWCILAYSLAFAAIH